MPNYAKLSEDASDQYLAVLAEGQEQFLKTLKTWSTWIPSTPQGFTTPFNTDFLPTPREIAEANFAFMAKLLKQQKSFADKLFSTSTATA
jgi:hypothetical protein